MNALEIKHQLYVRQWAAELEEFQRSGMTIKEWCQTNNIALSTFSMHRRAVRAAACTAIESKTGESISDIASLQNPDLSPPSQPATINLAQVHLKSSSAVSGGIHIQCSDATIDIGQNVPEDQIRILFEVMFNVQQRG